MSSDDHSKCRDDYAYGSEEVFRDSDSEAASINTATYISGGDDNDEAQESTVKKEVMMKVMLESDTPQGNLEESSPGGDQLEDELVDETRDVDCDTTASNQDIQEGGRSRYPGRKRSQTDQRPRSTGAQWAQLAQ